MQTPASTEDTAMSATSQHHTEDKQSHSTTDNNQPHTVTELRTVISNSLALASWQ